MALLQHGLSDWIRLLDADDIEVREEAAGALVEMAGAAIPELDRAIATSPSAEVRARAAGALERIESILRRRRGGEVRDGWQAVLLRPRAAVRTGEAAPLALELVNESARGRGLLTPRTVAWSLPEGDVGAVAHSDVQIVVTEIGGRDTPRDLHPNRKLLDVPMVMWVGPGEAVRPEMSAPTSLRAGRYRAVAIVHDRWSMRFPGHPATLPEGLASNSVEFEVVVHLPFRPRVPPMRWRAEAVEAMSDTSPR